MEHSNENKSLEPVNFHGDTIFAVEHNGEPYTPVRPIIENMGIAWCSQYTKLKKNRDRFSVKEIITQLPGDDQKRMVVCVPVKKLAGFLSTIYPNKCKADVREKVVAYINECDQALWNYWSKGRAVNPRFEQPVHQVPQVPQSLPEALRLAADLAEEKQKLIVKIEVDRPKVEFVDAVDDPEKAIYIGAFAKLLRNAGIDTGRTRLFTWLKDNKFLQWDNVPYQKYIDNGYFRVVQRKWEGKNGPMQGITPMITIKGQIAAQRAMVEERARKKQKSLGLPLRQSHSSARA